MTQEVSHIDCFVTHWVLEMRFLHWWSPFDTLYFRPEGFLCYRFQTGFLPLASAFESITVGVLLCLILNGEKQQQQQVVDNLGKRIK